MTVRNSSVRRHREKIVILLYEVVYVDVGKDRTEMSKVGCRFNFLLS